MKKLAYTAAIVLLVSCGRHEQKKAATAAPQTTATQDKSSPAAQPQASSTEIGGTMPDYSATNLDGSKFDLSATRGKVVLLNLWATWCGPCRYEIPELQTLHAKYGPRGFEVIGVSVDEGSADEVRQFVQQQKMTYPIVVDPEAKLANLFQTSVLPTTVVIDRKGTILWKKFGAIDPGDEELKAVIEKAL